MYIHTHALIVEPFHVGYEVLYLTQQKFVLVFSYHLEECISRLDFNTHNACRLCHVFTSAVSKTGTGPYFTHHSDSPSVCSNWRSHYRPHPSRTRCAVSLTYPRERSPGSACCNAIGRAGERCRLRLLVLCTPGNDTHVLAWTSMLSAPCIIKYIPIPAHTFAVQDWSNFDILYCCF